MAAYSFPTGVEDGHQVELENGVTYKFKAEFKRWDVVKGTGNSVWITDQLPDEQYTSNGDLWFDNTEDTMQLFLWHEDSGAWLPVAPPTTLEGRVDAGEATQQAIIAQIQESLVEQADLADRISDGEAEQVKLKNKINALEGVLGEHSFVFTTSNRNPRPGEFNLQDGGMNITNSVESADYIALSNVDANGKDVNLDRIVENDVLRIGSFEGGSAELRVTSSTGGLCQFEQVSGDLNRLSEMPHDFVLLSSFDPAGLATIEYVDAQDEILSTMITQNGRALNDKVSKSGNQNLDKSKAWKLKQEKQDGGESTFVSINDGEMNLYHVATPSAATHAANKEYVDNKLAGGGAGLTLDIWKYKGWNYDKTRLQDGEWCFTDFQDYTEIYLAQKNSRGQYYHPTSSSSTSEYTYQVTNSGGIGLPMTVMDQSGKNQFFAEPKKFVFNKGNTNYTLIECVKVRKPSAQLTADTDFMLNIPGLIGPVAGW